MSTLPCCILFRRQNPARVRRHANRTCPHPFNRSVGQSVIRLSCVHMPQATAIRMLYRPCCRLQSVRHFWQRINSVDSRWRSVNTTGIKQARRWWRWWCTAHWRPAADTERAKVLSGLRRMNFHSWGLSSDGWWNEDQTIDGVKRCWLNGEPVIWCVVKATAVCWGLYHLGNVIRKICFWFGLLQHLCDYDRKPTMRRHFYLLFP